MKYNTFLNPQTRGYPIPSAQSGAWCKGFVAAMMEFNKCFDMRIIDYKTRQVVEEFKGHSWGVRLN